MNNEDDDIRLHILRDFNNNNDETNLSFRQKFVWASKQFAKHFVNQFRPSEILQSIKTYPYLLTSFVIVLSVCVVIAKCGIPYYTCKYAFSLWTLVTIGHLIQAVCGLCLSGEHLVKRILKVPFHLFLSALSFLYWLKMGEWMHFGYHHFLYASFLLYYTFERLGKSAAFVIGIPLAISDIVGYGEFPIFSKPSDFSGLDNVLKEQPWKFLVPTAILFLCELLIEGPLVQTFIDIKNQQRESDYAIQNTIQ